MDLSTFINLSLGQKKLTPRQILSDPVLFLAFGFGSGLAKKAPGTMGTVAAIPVYLVLAQMSSLVYILATLATCILGVWICGITADRLGEHDFSGIVWDEIAGLLVAMSFVPFSWEAVVYGFALFRLFDIVKPWPINWIDKKITGGLGIMLDDIVAGIVAGGVLWWLKQVFY